MDKAILYYTNNRLPEPMMSIVQRQISNSGLPVLSVSLKPIDFGENHVLNLKSGAITMFRQILFGLEKCKADVVFMAEHDVLYHEAHWDFSPPTDDTYYYNTNVWRWWFPRDHFITYDGIVSTSSLCAKRSLLLDHYRFRLAEIERFGYEDDRNPGWARKMGYEPGLSKDRSGLWDGKIVQRKAEFPNVDIRHNKTITTTKVTLDRFRRQPANWRQVGFGEIDGWNLKRMFDL